MAGRQVGRLAIVVQAQGDLASPVVQDVRYLSYLPEDLSSFQLKLFSPCSRRAAPPFSDLLCDKLAGVHMFEHDRERAFSTEKIKRVVLR